MGTQTGISWTDSTLNFWVGCTKVSPGCDGCYAEHQQDHRFGRVKWGAGQPRHLLSEATRRKPIAWNKARFIECAACGFRGEVGHSQEFCGRCRAPESALNPARRRVFCQSLSDWADNEVPFEWVQELFATIQATPNLEWLMLTKRIGNVPEILRKLGLSAMPPNCRLGITIVNQPEADRDLPKIFNVRARAYFISGEPLLGAINLQTIPWQGGFFNVLNGTVAFESHGRDAVMQVVPHGSRFDVLGPRLSWVIAGGETDQGAHKARPSHPDWFRSLRDQCERNGVAFHFKQWGEYGPTSLAFPHQQMVGNPHGSVETVAGTYMPDSNVKLWPVARVGKKVSGRQLDGYEHNGFPEALA